MQGLDGVHVWRNEKIPDGMIRPHVQSLEDDQILFDPESAEKIFKEAGVFFSGQIKKDFQQLIAFNKAITDERRGYLEKELAETEDAIKKIKN